MYSKGTFIVHSTKGVCRVEDICMPDIERGSDRRFYLLSTVGRNRAEIYSPIDGKGINLRPIMSECEASGFISHIPSIPSLSVSGVRNRKEAYRRALFEPYPANLVSIIKTVYERSSAGAGSRKKLAAFELEYSARAKELLYTELSIALGMPAEDVEEYIVRRIDG